MFTYPLMQGSRVCVPIDLHMSMCTCTSARRHDLTFFPTVYVNLNAFKSQRFVAMGFYAPFAKVYM